MRVLKPFVPLFLVCITIVTFVSYTNAFELNLSVATDMPFYSPGQLVHVFGNLTKDDQTNVTCLVGLELVPPSENPFKKIFRTLKTGNESVSEGPMLILEAFPSDEGGNPKNIFKRTGYTFFNCYIHIINFSNETVDSVYITVNIFDQDLRLLGARVEVYTDQHPQDEIEIIPQIFIPEWATLGNATVYVNLFSNFPSLSGYPYCREKTALFNIVDPSGGGADVEAQTTSIAWNGNGTYSTTFRMPSVNCELGNHTAYVSTRYEGQLATNHATFEVKVSGDIYLDGRVDWKDLLILARAYGSSIGEPGYVPEADFNSDGKIDWKDLLTLALNYGSIIW